MKGGTLFSGIGAPECAAPHIDWRWSAEIDPFASAVHAARFPSVTNLGDVNEINADAIEPVDLIAFGSPCQSFSVAGKRLGLDDPRGNLAFVGLRIVERVRPSWVVFENVPGLLSSDDGRDFGTFLVTLGQCGYGFAYRILDAQFAGVPQRRRRVFVVGYLGDWRPAAAVLFEPESLSRHSASRREAGQGIAPTIEAGANRTGGPRPPGTTVDTADSLIVHSLRADGFDASEDGTGRGTPLTLAIRGRGDSHDLEYRDDGIANAILTPNGGRAGIGVGAVAAFQQSSLAGKGTFGYDPDARVAKPVKTQMDGQMLQQAMSVRRLTPRECERLQGFPDDWTAIQYRGKPAADGPRYRALGNSMAVPVIGWILDRARAV